MSCNTTHHTACDCREDHFKKLEQELLTFKADLAIAVEALNEFMRVMEVFTDLCDCGEKSCITCHETWEANEVMKLGDKALSQITQDYEAVVSVDYWKSDTHGTYCADEFKGNNPDSLGKALLLIPKNKEEK